MQIRCTPQGHVATGGTKQPLTFELVASCDFCDMTDMTIFRKVARRLVEPIRRTKQKLRPRNTDRHVILLKPQNLAFIRVPKCASSSVRFMLASSFGIELDESLSPNKDRFWREAPDDLATNITQHRFNTMPNAKNIWSFTLIRHPVARLHSCWNNKVIENPKLSNRMERMGIVSGMDFDSFVARTAQHDDESCDVHLQSLTSIVCYNGHVAPNFVGRLEFIDQDWHHIRFEVEMRTGVDMGPLQRRNVRSKSSSEIFETFSENAKRNILERYESDFRQFYPEFWAEQSANRTVWTGVGEIKRLDTAS